MERPGTGASASSRKPGAASALNNPHGLCSGRGMLRAVPFGRHGASALLDFQEPHHAAAAVRDALGLGAKPFGLALDIREVVQVRSGGRAGLECGHDLVGDLQLGLHHGAQAVLVEPVEEGADSPPLVRVCLAVWCR